MKRKKSLREVDFSPLTNREALSTKGGGKWVKTDDGWTYLLDEVMVYGEAPGTGPQSECPQCQSWHQMNSGQPSSDGGSVTTPLGEYLFNTLPHQYGWGNHR